MKKLLGYKFGECFDELEMIKRIKKEVVKDNYTKKDELGDSSHATGLNKHTLERSRHEK